MDRRQNLSITDNFLFGAIAGFRFLTHQFFQTLITGINTLDSVGCTCTLNHSDFQKRFQFINVSLQK